MIFLWNFPWGKKWKKIPLTGVSIEKRVVRYIHLDWEKGQLHVKQALKLPSPKEKNIFDRTQDWLSLFLSLKKESFLPLNPLMNISFMLKETALHTLCFPLMSHKELREAFKWEFQRIFGMGLDDTCRDSVALELSGGRKGQHCFLTAAIKKCHVLKLMKLLKKSRIGAACLEPPQISLLRAFKGVDSLEREPMMLAFRDEEEEITSLIISENEDIRSAILPLKETVEQIHMEVALCEKDIQNLSGQYWLRGCKDMENEITQILPSFIPALSPWKKWEIEKNGFDLDGFEVAVGVALRDFS